MFPLFVGSPVEALFKILATGVHRCPVVDGAGEMTAMISQLDVVDFLANHLDKLTIIGGKTLRELGMLKKVASVKESDNVVDCLKVLQKNKVSAVAVLTDDGEVIGAFSSHDVKVCFTEFWFRFLIRFVTFVQYIIKHEYTRIYGPLSKFMNTAVGWPVALPPDSTMAQAIRFARFLCSVIPVFFFFSDSNLSRRSLQTDMVHRLWIVGDNNEPMGVVALTDVVKMLVQFYYENPTEPDQ